MNDLTFTNGKTVQLCQKLTLDYQVIIKSLGLVLLVLGILSLFADTTHAQIQQKIWYFNGEAVDFSTSPPTVFALPQDLPGANRVTNGAYDENGDILFYVIDDQVFDKNGDLIAELCGYDGPGVFQYSQKIGPEILIVPVPESLSLYYIIFQDLILSPNETRAIKSGLRYSVMDVSLNNGLGGIVPGTENSIIADHLPRRLGSIAVGPDFYKGERWLYFTTGIGFEDSNNPQGQIWKAKISKDSIESLLVETTNLLHFGDEDFNDRIATVEVEISHDGSMLAFANSKYQGKHNNTKDLTIVHLDGNGDINTSLGTDGFTHITLSGNTNQPFTGLEFAPDNSRLLVNIRNQGITWIDIDVGKQTFKPSNTFISNSEELSFSQIELAYNGFMYAALNTSVLRSIDWQATSPRVNSPFYDIFLQSGAIISNSYFAGDENGNWLFHNIYILPDQLDGFNLQRFLTEKSTN